MYRTTVADRVTLGLIFDHSGWARSVRWSCGRPGFVWPSGPLFDHEAAAQRTMRELRMGAYVGLSVTEPRDLFRVTVV